MYEFQPMKGGGYQEVPIQGYEPQFGGGQGGQGGQGGYGGGMQEDEYAMWLREMANSNINNQSTFGMYSDMYADYMNPYEKVYRERQQQESDMKMIEILGGSENPEAQQMISLLIQRSYPDIYEHMNTVQDPYDYRRGTYEDKIATGQAAGRTPSQELYTLAGATDEQLMAYDEYKRSIPWWKIWEDEVAGREKALGGYTY